MCVSCWTRESWSIDFSWPLLVDQTVAVSPYGYPRSPLLWPPPHPTPRPERTRWRRRSPPSLPPPCSASGAEASATATATASCSPRSAPAPPLPNPIVPPSRPPLHAGSQRPRRRLLAASPALLLPLRPRSSPKARQSKALLYFYSPSSPPSRLLLLCSLLRNCVVVGKIQSFACSALQCDSGSKYLVLVLGDSSGSGASNSYKSGLGQRKEKGKYSHRKE